MRFRPIQCLLFLLDGALTAVAAYLALCLRLGIYPLPPAFLGLFQGMVGALIGCRVASLYLLRVYRISMRHTGIRDLEVILAGTLLSSLCYVAYLFVVYRSTFVVTVAMIEWFLGTALISGIRAGYRIVLGIVKDIGRFGRRVQSTRPTRRVLILGAGALGASLAREMRRRPMPDATLVGFVDDDPDKRNLLLHGAPVLGTVQDLRRIVERRNVNDVIVAMPSANGPRIRELIALCEELPVRLRISPGFAELDVNDGWRNLRDVSIEDLLRRPPVHVNVEEIADYVADERVLITGAGGSIGSELVRQILPIGPRELILLGHGENSIYEIQQELRRKHDYTASCVIADIRDLERLQDVFDRYRPTVVFHAAAHKHVPLMETDITEAVTNNVMGTRNLAQIASRSGVKRFVMISTDKAVNPTSIMGASKRIAERVIQAESRGSTTQFAVVRFGNVLGSRGSVVPLMRKQIEAGGPVTVTHPDVTRYFMTIPEAVQLVIQAGAMGGRGTIYILNMGEPVKILDLARDLIRLSGLVPDKDIPIQFTGLRPGEKLYEELLTAQEGVSMTRHQQIFVAPPAEVSRLDFDDAVEDLVAAAREGNRLETRRLIHALVPTYTGDGQTNVVPTALGLDVEPAEAPPPDLVSGRGTRRPH